MGDADDVYVLPASFAQQRLWFASQLDPDASAYNLAGAVRIRGALDTTLLERAVAELVTRHEALRTTLEDVSSTGEVVQLVHESLQVQLQKVDFSATPEAFQEQQWQRWAEREVQARFDLASGPLLRVSLLRQSDTQHVLLWVVHHAVFDGWSTTLVFRELVQLYAALKTGSPSPLPPLSLQYADFAAWQRSPEQQAALSQQLEYWKRQLADANHTLELPTDRPRPATRSQRGARYFFELPPALTTELRALARSHDATLYSVLLAAFVALIERYTGVRDVSVGTPVTNRERVELESVVGCFANTLVLRCQLEPELTFAGLLAHVRDVVRDAQAQQDVPFEQVVDAVNPRRDLSRAPLFQLLFALQPELGSLPQIAGLELELLDLDVGGAQFDVSLELVASGDGLRGAIEYDTQLFELGSIERLAECFRALLTAAAGSPDQVLSRLPLIADAERVRLLSLASEAGAARELEAERGAGLQRRAAGQGVTSVFPHMFERAAARSPDAVAVVAGAEQLSYRELDARANRLARQLVRKGVTAETRVGICVPRCVDMIVSVLAVLKTGAAYVPIDPQYPAERIATIAHAAKLRVLLVHAAETPASLECEALDLVHDAERIGAEDAAPLAVSIDALQCAYVLFTSGSTGTPKGVMVSHGALADFVAVAAQHYAITRADRVLQFASLSFDASVEEIMSALSTGATLVLRSDTMLETPEAFVSACEADQLTVLDLPTSYWHLLTGALARGLRLPEAVRLVIIGGEAALPERVREFRAATPPSLRLLNTYGPTETCVVASSCELTAAPTAHVSIGRPLHGVEAYVLDAALEPTPVGVVGELYIGGRGLARGYWARPDLTAERFVPHPFSTEPGARLYRSGDRVRLRADGQLEFRGRSDRQVKLRGFRIELGEIEAQLAALPHVHDAVVQLRDDQRLVAYLATGPEPSAASVRSALEQRLPSYMIPSAFVLLPELPRTAHGKIARHALPEPALTTERVERTAASDMEAQLLEIWRALLGREQIGFDDNFFELGGDSILALRLTAQARERGIALSAKQVFQHQTLAQLALVARPHVDSIAPSTVHDGEALPLTPIQRWFFELELPRPQHWNQALSVRLREPTSVTQLAAAWAFVADHHDALRLRFERTELGWTQRYGDTPASALTLVDVAQQEAEIDAAHTSLDLANGPLVAARYFDMGPAQPAELWLCAHHLVVDAVSWRIILDDLQRVYAQLRAGEAPQLPRKTASYAAFARQVTQPSTAAVLPRERMLPLYSEAANLEGRVSMHQQQLPAELRHALPAYRLKLDELLATALSRALLQLTQAQTLCFAIETHGRDAVPGLDVSRTVGWFTQLSSVSVSREALREPGAAIEHVKTAMRAAALDYTAAEICFNYLGSDDTDPAFELIDAPGRERAADAPRAHELEVDALVRRGQLHVTWSHVPARLPLTQVLRLAAAFEAELHTLVQHCAAPSAGGVVPADFPDAALTQADLQQLLAASNAPARELLDVYPLSPPQQGLAFHSLWEEGAGSYVEQVTCRIDGALDTDCFERAWQLLSERHDVLRTTFALMLVDEPMQCVWQKSVITLEQRDLRGLSSAEQATIVAEHLLADRACGYALASGPLMRLALYQLGPDAWQLVWSHHHLILDGWSAAVLLREVFALYQDPKARLPVRRRFRDYIACVRALEQSAAERFFRSMLSDFDSPTALPYRRAVPTDEAGFAVHSSVCSARVTQRLESVARQQRVTLSTLLQAAWSLVLGRIARCDDVVFGVVTAGRSAPLPDIDSMVGLFINTLPLRVQLRHAQNVGDFLRALLAQTTDMVQFEHMPLARAKACSAVPGGRPLFESLLVFENYPAAEQDALELRVRDVEFSDQTDYPLTLSANPGEQLTLRLCYAKRHFEDDAAQQLLALVQHVLCALAEHMQQPLGTLPLLAQTDEPRVVHSWNASARVYPEGRVLGCFEAHAARSPDAAALIFEGQTLSYRELNQRANRVAQLLQRRGVGPDHLVAVAAERSVELVVALLATWKAGAAYVPIDPEYPEARIELMLRDAGASVLLSQWPVASRLPAHSAEVICLDADRALIDAEPDTDLGIALEEDQLAYVIYTSGSTGTPKGAGNTQRGLYNRLCWMRDYLQLTAADRVLQKTPFSFDVSAWELFLPLMSGACLVVARPGDHRDPERLRDLIRTHSVSALHFVPPMLGAFLESGAAAHCDSLRHVVCSGEALPVDVARRFFEVSSAALHNLYGPTEASIDVSYWQCSRADLQAASLPIGYPIANTQLYVLDRQGQLVPRGCAGELHLGGIGLARAYHARPDLTAERFVPDPFGTPGARLYRTGDLARQRSDGAVEYLGRIDHQVKIRGLRVELGEIEARLLAHSDVREAVVVARSEPSGAKRLVAYVSTHASVATAELGAFVAEALPEYMVPSSILVLDGLPLSPNGKVDRRALPAPESVGAGAVYIAPASEIERALSDVWAAVLHHERVGVTDDFFALGGDSIVSLQIIARAAQRGVKLTPKQLFEYPTIAQLAQHVGMQSTTEPQPTAAGETELSPEEWAGLLDELDR
jgi:amino acid adenylation domain-containing protein/non-ribosomal peptide synthase protein (TIGR01720 family)